MRVPANILRAAVMAAVMLLTPVLAHAQEFKIVVNASNSVDAISADEASKLFLKQATKFSNGVAAAPVDQKGATRAAFCKGVHGRAASAIDTYWQQQIFSGKDIPPAAKAGDDDVIAFVKSTPGGIGYVSAAAATAGVKVISIK
jgi:ABC-type phosphate transport system substrate-binding protein